MFVREAPPLTSDIEILVAASPVLYGSASQVATDDAQTLMYGA